MVLYTLLGVPEMMDTPPIQNNNIIERNNYKDMERF